ncbi:MAG: hypothetical protein RIF46_15175 [Cyclobacteriaceae bacterium]
MSFFIDKLYEGGMPKSLTDYTLENDLEGMVFNLGNTIANEIKSGRYDLINCGLNDNGEGVMLFRLYTPTGINYHEYHVVISDGIPKIGDLHIYATGEYLSQVFSRMIYSSLEGNPIVSKNLSLEAVEAMEAMGKATELSQSGNYQQAFDELQKAKVRFGNEKHWNVLNLTMASQLDSIKYIELLEDFKSKYERDPTWLLMGIDYYFLKKDWDGALKTLDDLNTAVGYDPILDFYKSIVYYYQDNLEKSYNEITELPEYIYYTIPDVLFTKLEIELSLKKYSKAVVSLDSINSYFGTSLEEVDLSDYPDFVQSQQYRELSKRSK